MNKLIFLLNNNIPKAAQLGRNRICKPSFGEKFIFPKRNVIKIREAKPKLNATQTRTNELDFTKSGLRLESRKIPRLEINIIVAAITK